MLKFKNLLELTDFFKTEEDCVNYLKDKQIAKGLHCPYCGGCHVYEPENNDRFRCHDCKAKFSVRVGTLFEGSKISLRKWFMAMYLLMAHKKGVSSCQLAKDISVTQKTAWFMLHRIRHASDMANAKKEMFKGTCEVDETYVGGKEGNKHVHNRFKDTKAVVVTILNRDTKEVRTFHTPNNTYGVVGQKIIDNVELGSTVITDEASIYRNLHHFYEHETVNHSKHEYVKVERIKRDGSREAFKVTTNSVEGFFSLVKRGINGIYHWVSKKHIDKYLAEFSMRYNTRFINDSERMEVFLSNHLNYRLRYSQLIA